VKLSIGGQSFAFTDIRAFRAQFDLPDDFGVAWFEPKDYIGLGSVDKAGAALNQVRAAALIAIPLAIKLTELITVVSQLSVIFQDNLYAVNDQALLRDVEVDFAVSGFADVCRDWAFALIKSNADQSSPPVFAEIYGSWLGSTVRISTRQHEDAHLGAILRVQIVNHAYGRVGLSVIVGDHTHYLLDSSLACPAEGYMLALLGEVCERLRAAISP
jgi:hypothetical protein